MDDFQRWAALAIFAAGFASFLVFEKYRHWGALAAAALAVALGVFTLAEAMLCVNWPIVVVFFTTLVAAEVFMLSGAAAVAAEAILARFKSPAAAILVLCALTGFLSISIENVACVLIAAPVALSLAKKLGMPPQRILVACALASNLQGCALLVGDPPSMLLAGEARLSFSQFIWLDGKPSIFWAVQAGALVGLAFLWLVFRKHRGAVEIEREARLFGVMPTVYLAGLVLAIAIDTQLERGVGWGAAGGCAFFAALSFTWLAWKTRGRGAPDEDVEEAAIEHKMPSVRSYVRGLDWRTTLFIASVFVPVAALAHHGWIERLSAGILAVSSGNLTAAFVILVATAVLASAFVDNIPFLLVMLPAVTTLAAGSGFAGKPIFLYFGLLLGASVGGNITPIGAQANIAAVGLLRKHGSPVDLKSYLALSLPYTLLAVAVASLFTYLVYGPW